MKSKVFVSCGQRPNEKEMAGKIAHLLRDRGFTAYVAIDVQTILDVNVGIIRELKDSDCYLFVNFLRETKGTEYQGSLFSHQELAIAYALGFERILVVNQEGVRPEGMLASLVINTETFAAPDNCIEAVERALDRAQWTPAYSRRLRIKESLRFSPEVLQYGALKGRFLYADIVNGRPDIPALEATARLAAFGKVGGPLKPCLVRSPLKASGRRDSFAHTIFPQSHEEFDMLTVGTHTAGETAGMAVYLNSALDLVPHPSLPITPGVWILRYQFVAIGFPQLFASIELTIQDWNNPQAKLVSQETT